MNHTRPILRLIDDFKRRRTGTGLLRVQQQKSGAQFTLGDLPHKVDFGALNAELMELRQDLHQVACSVLAHVEKYGNARLIDRLIAAIPAFMDTHPLMDWFTVFGPVEFVSGKAKYKARGQSAIEVATALPFWTIPNAFGVTR
ncbi:hypothetical protein XH97_29615 [Bradyrhizobium sp. CCBAU 53380]|nr:hypothetical protein [Bradyrhizobium sp. CCBAU 53380]